MNTRIMIADDHGVLRAGLRALLEREKGLEVVCEAATGEDAVARAVELAPDIVLLDISMPGPGGIEVAKRIKSEVPGVRVLILTVHEDDSLVREAIRSGVSGYVIKRALESELINAIRAVSRGEIYVHPAMTRALFAEPRSTRSTGDADVDVLTPRETEVLTLIVQGHTNRQVAEILNLSVRTVESHRGRLMGKLGLRNRVELVRFASKHGLLK